MLGSPMDGRRSVSGWTDPLDDDDRFLRRFLKSGGFFRLASVEIGAEIGLSGLVP